MMIRHHDIDVGDVKPGSDQSLPPELAKHDSLDRPQVIIGASITVCDLVYVFSTKMSSLGSRGGGGKIDDLMVLLRNVPQASKSRKSLFQLAQAASREVFVYGLLP